MTRKPGRPRKHVRELERLKELVESPEVVDFCRWIDNGGEPRRRKLAVALMLEGKGEHVEKT